MSLISVNHLTFGYEGSYTTIFEDVSFSLDTNWRLGLIGRNGRGKTTFLKLLMGKEAYEGEIASSETFDYFPLSPADPSIDTLSVVDTVCREYDYWRLVRELSLLQVDEEVLYRPFDTTLFRSPFSFNRRAYQSPGHGGKEAFGKLFSGEKGIYPGFP